MPFNQFLTRIGIKRTIFLYKLMKNSNNQIPTFVLLSFIVVAVAACGRRTESPMPLERERFVEVYVAAIQRTGPDGINADSTSRISLDSILARYGTDQTQFWATVDSYRAKPGEWKSFFDEVTKRLDKEGKRG
jgi:hypothetical protein